MSDNSPPRAVLVARALHLSWLSVAWAALSGSFTLVVGARDHSVAVVGVGLNLFCDLVGSLALIWRFTHERRQSGAAAMWERIARMVVGTALLLVSVFLVVQSVRRLSGGTGAGSDLAAMLATAASVVVLAPLARAKRRLGTRLQSGALRGDGTLSGVGAAVALLALAGLLVTRTVGWWWADPVAALLVATAAAVEARRVLSPRG